MRRTFKKSYPRGTAAELDDHRRKCPQQQILRKGRIEDTVINLNQELRTAVLRPSGVWMNHQSARGKSKAPAGNGKVAEFPGTCDSRERRESCRPPKTESLRRIGGEIKRWKERFADGGRADLFGSLSLLCTRASGAELRGPAPISAAD